MPHNFSDIFTSNIPREHYSLHPMLNNKDDDDFHFTIQFVEANEDIVEHDHDFTELVIVLDGTATHNIHNKKYPLCKGDVFAINQSIRHGYTDCRNFFHCNILYQSDKLMDPKYKFQKLLNFHSMLYVEAYENKDEIKKYTLSERHLETTLALLKIIQDEVINKEDDYETAIYRYYYALLHFMFRSLKINFYENQGKDVHFAESISFIEENYNKKISTADISKIAAMSPRNYERVFKKKYSITPKEYIISLRLNQAKRLLKHTHMNLTDIAEQTSFYDSASLSRSFKTKFGITPSEYRKAEQKS